MRSAKWKILALGLLVFVACLTAAAGWLLHSAAGFSARAQPSRPEAMLATWARQAAMPQAARSRVNPAAASPNTMQEASAHYADHCAVCHGADGSGTTMLGNGMYPKPPDMRLPATQRKTDGELFSAIENGIRMSGMPAFGNGSGDTATELESWKLVVFLRHLPAQSADETRTVESMMPRTPAEMEEEKQEADFLSGADEHAGAVAHSGAQKREEH